MGLVRKAQKTGQASSPEVAKAATSMSKSDVKDFASTKHKGLPEKKKIAEGKRDGKGAKSKGYSLRDWFKGGGWVQTGGKYDGKPCAKQPGQKTKPYCRDADDRASMSKDERNKRAAKKRKEDPNPNRKGRAKNVTQEEMMLEKKDACYHKVKARYDVWPSAYASGALVKCRKKGAKNWGNKSKKEGFEGNVSFSQFNEKAQKCWATHKKVGMKMKGGKLVNDCRPKNEELQTEGQKCWKGYEKKGTKKMFGKTYNNCVKKEEVTNESKTLSPAEEARLKRKEQLKSQGKISTGDLRSTVKDTKGKGSTPLQDLKRRKGVSEDWQKKSGKNPEGGLNEKGRKSYERENPGSDLKRPSKKVGNPRRKSFCARMKGMKKKLTSKKTASDPDSRINKSLRAWNC